jgi:LysR family transcriptional regulator, regulator for genes of the gallate degradation pathway
MHSPELPNLMQVRAFLRVVEYGSVSKASAVLFRAQPVVTRAILALEKRLGALLFERTVNGMRLTDYGDRVIPRARRALEELLAVPSLLGQVLGHSAEPLYLFQTRRLEMFAKLCETHHMQTTASALGVSQPAISAAIKVLEQGSGAGLFERTPHGLLPTRACLGMLLRVRRALNELRHIDADIAALSGSLQGAVHVGALPLGRTGILPEAIVRLTLQHPHVRVVTNESPFDLLASEMRAGDVDFVLGALRPSAYASDLHSEALPRAGSPARQLLDAFFAHIGIAAPSPVIETGDLAILRGVLLRSDMLAAVSAHQLEHEMVSGELVRLPLSLSHTTRPIGLISRAGALQSPAAQALMDKIREVVGEAAMTKAEVS